MFGKWIGGNAKKQPVSVEYLAALGPYAQLPPAELERAAEAAEVLTLKAGLIDDELPANQRIFLRDGSLQIQTRSGWVLQLRAGTPPARYPLPSAPAVTSLYAPEDTSVLCVPATVLPVPSASPGENLQPPELTDAEADALEQLRSHFRRERGELPSLPDLAIKIGRAIDNPDNSNEDIARLIQLDPALAARILSVVNSAAFGGLTRISSIPLATARLGRSKVRSLVYSCLLKNIFQNGPSRLKRHVEALWEHSAHVAALSFVLARETPGIDPEQALLAGLVHDIGAVAVIGGISGFPALAERDEVLNYAIASLRVEVGILTIQRWQFDAGFDEVVRHAENWSRVGTAIPENPDVVILAQLHALIGSPRQPELPPIDTVPAFVKLARGKLTPRHSLALLEEADADVREIRALVSGG